MSMVQIKEKIQREQAGFTLIEMSIVLLVIAILVGLLYPQLQGFRRDAQIEACKGNVNTLQSAVTAYMVYSNNVAPATGTGSSVQINQTLLINRNYIPEELKCPVDGTNYTMDTIKGRVNEHTH